MADLAFGYGCPRCGSSFAVKIGGNGRCPDCGAGLQPLPETPRMPQTVTGFECGACGFSAGMMIGSDGHCPECGAAVS